MLALAGLLAASALAQTSPRRQVRVTWYATPAETDFGARAVEIAEWRRQDSKKVHRSRFASGFTSRRAHDPKHKDLMGVGMEGAGWIAPELHRDDAALSAALESGYRVLTLERWDAKRRKASFVLTRAPLGGVDDAPLVEGVSAAVRAGDKLFPAGRWVRLFKDGKPAGLRRIHDECSSCVGDDHLDLYETPSGRDDQEARWEAELLPADFKPAAIQ